MLILSFNGYPKSASELEHYVLTAQDKDTTLSVRIRGSDGHCDIKDIQEIKGVLDISDTPKEGDSLDALFEVKTNEKLATGDVVVTTSPALIAGKTVAKGTYFTILQTRGDELQVNYFESSGWISRNSIKHAVELQKAN